MVETVIRHTDAPRFAQEGTRVTGCDQFDVEGRRYELGAGRAICVPPSTPVLA